MLSNSKIQQMMMMVNFSCGQFTAHIVSTIVKAETLFSGVTGDSRPIIG